MKNLKNKKNSTHFLISKTHNQSNGLKKKLINHVTNHGKKQTSEKNIAKSFKATQKYEKKNHIICHI